MEKSILLINDVTGYGRVSTFAMLPVMAKYGLHPYVLPTALVSNTLDYGISETLDTTEFMDSTVKNWNELSFHFDNIATGFIANKKQVDIIDSIIASNSDAFVFVDPIMADSGELYPDMYPGAIESNRKLASKADVLMPNITEACLLTDLFVGNKLLDESQQEEVLHALIDLGPKNVVLKGCSNDKGQHYNIVCENGRVDKVYFDRLPVSFIGTGDIFAGVLISEYLCGINLESAVQKASDFICEVIKENINAKEPFDIKFENTLNKL